MKFPDHAYYSALISEAFAIYTLLVKEGRDEKLLPGPQKSSGMFCFFLKWRDDDVISVLFFLSELWSEGAGFFCFFFTLGAGGEPFALPESLFKEITQSPHLCCITGLSARPRTLDVPVRRQAGGFCDTCVKHRQSLWFFYFFWSAISVILYCVINCLCLWICKKRNEPNPQVRSCHGIQSQKVLANPAVCLTVHIHTEIQSAVNVLITPNRERRAPLLRQPNFAAAS